MYCYTAVLHTEQRCNTVRITVYTIATRWRVPRLRFLKPLPLPRRLTIDWTRHIPYFTAQESHQRPAKTKRKKLRCLVDQRFRLSCLQNFSSKLQDSWPIKLKLSASIAYAQSIQVGRVPAQAQARFVNDILQIFYHPYSITPSHQRAIIHSLGPHKTIHDKEKCISELPTNRDAKHCIVASQILLFWRGSIARTPV